MPLPEPPEKCARRETIPPTGRAVPGSVSREPGTVTGPGSRGSPANHLDQTTAAYPPGHKTVKTVSASNADAESR
jgi:hypothetical protein